MANFVIDIDYDDFAGGDPYDRDASRPFFSVAY